MAVGFSKKTAKFEHMQCGCKETHKPKHSGTNSVGGRKCECTITNKKGFVKSKKGGIKRFIFTTGIDMGVDPNTKV